MRTQHETQSLLLRLAAAIAAASSISIHSRTRRLWPPRWHRRTARLLPMNRQNRTVMIRPTLRAHYQTCLGGPFPKPTPLNTQVRETMAKDGYRIESLTYEVATGRPSPGPAAGAGLGYRRSTRRRESPSGISTTASITWANPNRRDWPAIPMHHTAVALAREGYVVLCPDAMCFEERQDPTEQTEGGQLRAVRVPPRGGAGNVPGLEERAGHAAGRRLALRTRPEVRRRPVGLLRPLHGLDPCLAGRALWNRD